MKTKLDTIKDDQLKQIIFDAVWAAQQTLTDNDQKKQYVLKVVQEYLAKVGLKLTDEEIDILIESAVLSMKVETK